MAEATDNQFDVIVVGAGLRGLATVLASADRGLDVVVLEKSDMVGGAAAYSRGHVWIPGNYVERHAAPVGQSTPALPVQLRLSKGPDKVTNAPMPSEKTRTVIVEGAWVRGVRTARVRENRTHGLTGGGETGQQRHRARDYQ